MLNLSHKNLDVYQIALNLLKKVYQLTKHLPKEEQFLLISQLRRAAISVCSNIAEGAARRSKPEKLRFYEVSRSSVVEIDTQLEISLILEYLTRDQTHELERQVESVFRILSKMISNLKPTSH
jgi:four helix bundle protein